MVIPLDMEIVINLFYLSLIGFWFKPCRLLMKRQWIMDTQSNRHMDLRELMVSLKDYLVWWCLVMFLSLSEPTGNLLWRKSPHKYSKSHWLQQWGLQGWVWAMGSQSLERYWKPGLQVVGVLKVPVLKLGPEFLGHNGTFPIHDPFFSMGSQTFEPCQICQMLSDLCTEVSQRWITTCNCCDG